MIYLVFAKLLLNSHINCTQIYYSYEVLSTKNRTIALDCAILITETFWILENFPWVMQTKTEQNGFFPTLIVIAQLLLETTPYPLPQTGFQFSAYAKRTKINKFVATMSLIPNCFLNYSKSISCRNKPKTVLETRAKTLQKSLL